MQVKAVFYWLHHPWDCRKGALRQSEFETHHSLQMGGTGNSGLADGLQGHGGHAARVGRSLTEALYTKAAVGVLSGRRLQGPCCIVRILERLGILERGRSCFFLHHLDLASKPALKRSGFMGALFPKCGEFLHWKMPPSTRMLTSHGHGHNVTQQRSYKMERISQLGAVGIHLSQIH